MDRFTQTLGRMTTNLQTTLICKHCRQLYDPSIQFDPKGLWAELPPCSWHPGELKRLDQTAGPALNYRDVYEWTCCNRQVLSGIRHLGSSESEVPPRRSPGCEAGPHLADEGLTLELALSQRVQSVLEQLEQMERRNLLGKALPRVFVSYSHGDSAFVEGLCMRFEGDKVPYWRDEKDILVGEVVDRVISDGIQSHALFLIVLSTVSIGSRWVQRELDEASHESVNAGKILLPILAPGTPASAIPARLQRLKHADFSQGFDSTYRTLLKSILIHISRVSGDAA